MGYATPTDLQDYNGGATPPADAQVRLDRASDSVDELLLTAVYDVDSNGMPTEPDVLAACTKAACAIAQHRIDNGLKANGAPAAYDNVKIGSVQLARRASSGSSSAAADRYGPDAYGILQRAGLLPGLARSY